MNIVLSFYFASSSLINITLKKLYGVIMKNLLVTFGLCALLAAETQAAEEAACKQEGGRFTYDHPTMGKLTDLTQSGLESMRADAGDLTSTEAPVKECPKPKVSALDALKSWFKQFKKQKTEPLPENTGKSKHAAKNGNFEAVLVMTQDSESILAESIGASFTMFTESVSINVGEGIEALLLIRGCSANSNGDCLVTADYVIKSPDGSTFLEALNTDVWKEAAGVLSEYKLTNTRTGFVLTSDFDTGLYEVEVIVSDEISDKKLSLSGKVLVSPMELWENERI